MAVMITTVDNPHDPRTDYPAWNAWDISHGYHTSAFLARVLNGTDDFPTEYEDRLAELAIDEIIALHSGGIYKKLSSAA